MTTVKVWADRCCASRLALAYPAATHDVELRVEGVIGEALTDLLATASARVLAGTPNCRKIVYAAPTGDVAAVAAAEHAGFRYVVDVDVLEQEGIVELSLLVREPDFVTRVDMDLDRVPHT